MYQLAEHNGVLQTVDQHEFTASFQHVYQTYTKVYTHHSYEVHVQELTCKNSLLNISRITFNHFQLPSRNKSHHWTKKSNMEVHC